MVQPVSVHIHTANRISVHWRDDSAHYHVWINPDTFEIQGDILYKNPLVKRFEPGHFETRKLSASVKANKATITEVLAQVKREKLIETACEAMNEEARLAARVAYVRKYVMQWWRVMMLGQAPDKRPDDISDADFTEASATLAHELFH